MKSLDKKLNLKDLSQEELKTTTAGGPILEGAAWLLGFLSVKMEKIAEEGTHPAYSWNGGLK